VRMMFCVLVSCRLVGKCQAPKSITSIVLTTKHRWSVQKAYLEPFIAHVSLVTNNFLGLKQTKR
jgi:hypothetical protein